MHSYTRNWSSDEYLGPTSESQASEESPVIIDGNTMEVISSHNHNYKMGLYNSGTMVICSGNDSEKYWNDTDIQSSSECCSNDDPISQSPENICSNKRLCTSVTGNAFCVSPYQMFTNNSSPNNYISNINDSPPYQNPIKNENNCSQMIGTYNTNILSSTTTENSSKHCPVPQSQTFVRVVKKRNTANKKERRRTQSINNAYADLRDCIPSVPADTKLSKINNAYANLRECIPKVPADTKLSKIKTLRLATSYISYLKGVLDGEKPSTGFCAEIENLGGHRQSSRSNSYSKEIRGDITICTTRPQEAVNSKEVEKEKDDVLPLNMNKAKGRTGWPEHVWALEFKQEQNL